jgi:hypothetical protein
VDVPVVGAGDREGVVHSESWSRGFIASDIL